jgi:hypothetical protein
MLYASLPPDYLRKYKKQFYNTETIKGTEKEEFKAAS